MGRRKGLPSIRQRKDKNGKKIDCWEALLNLGHDPGTGKLKRVPVYGKSQEECRQKLIKALADVQNHAFVEPSKLTLGQWLDTWLTEYKSKKVRSTTYSNYETLIRVHIKKKLGASVLMDLKPEQIQRFYNEKQEEGLSNRTVRYLHTLLSGALTQAVKIGKISRNVAKLTETPKLKTKEMRVLTVDEQEKFYQAIRDERLGILFLLDLSTGLRRGELLALTWDNVNLKEGFIKISKSLVRVKTDYSENSKKKTELMIMEPKTDKGKRTIPLLDSIVTELKEHRKRQLKEIENAGDLFDDKHNLVFCTALGKPIEPRNLNRIFYRLIDKAGIDKANLHSLRHTFATRAVEAGIQIVVMRDLLGHENVSTTSRYSHALMGAKKEAMGKLSDLFAGKSIRPTEKVKKEREKDAAINN